MHFVVIAAFAIVLSARTPITSWWLFESVAWTYALVGGQVVVVALLAAVASWRVVRRVRRRPDSPESAQRLFSRVAAMLRMLLLVGLGVTVLLTPWMTVVEKQWRLGRYVAVDELAAMLPFFVGLIACWAVFYPADRALRRLDIERAAGDARSTRRIWGLGKYLLFNIRFQLLVIVVPMVGILAAYDLTDRYSFELYKWTHFDYADQAALVLSAALMFLIAPLILRFVWSTKALPRDGIRARLENICRKVRLRYRQILIWRSDGVVVNALVMGLIPTFRYIMLSDGLLATMRDEEIEAVFGHEAGHVKHHHMYYYLLFAAFSMLLVGGLLELVWRHVPYAQVKQYISISQGDWTHAVNLGAMGLVLLSWIFGFGWVSRRFERQSDTFGVRCVGQNMESCGRDCRVHHPVPGKKPDRRALCPAAADVFAGALFRIAMLNAMSPTAKTWLHGSIASRMDLVRALARNRGKLRRFRLTIIATKLVLVAGTTVGLVFLAQEYWPEEFITYWSAKLHAWTKR